MHPYFPRMFENLFEHSMDVVLRVTFLLLIERPCPWCGDLVCFTVGVPLLTLEVDKLGSFVFLYLWDESTSTICHPITLHLYYRMIPVTLFKNACTRSSKPETMYTSNKVPHPMRKARLAWQPHTTNPTTTNEPFQGKAETDDMVERKKGSKIIGYPRSHLPISFSKMT